MTVREFGDGPLSRAAALVYTLLVAELLLVVAALPGLAPLFLLDADASNIPLAAAAAIPFGPAFSAVLSTVYGNRWDLTELRPATAFWAGYRRNVWGVTRIWVPWLAWMTIIGVNLAHLGSAGVPPWWAILLVVIAVAASLWVANALVITSLFAFRTADVVRLAAYFLVRTRSVALGNAGLLALAVLVATVSSQAVVVLLASGFAFALLWTARPMVAAIRREFTA